MMLTWIVSDLSLLLKHTKQQKVKIKIKRNIKGRRRWRNIWYEQTNKKKQKLNRSLPNGSLQATWWRQWHNVNDGGDPSKCKLVSYWEMREINNIRSKKFLFAVSVQYDIFGWNSVCFPLWLERPSKVQYLNWYESNTFLYHFNHRWEIFWSYGLIRYKINSFALNW